MGYCHNCGARLREGADHCLFCGAKAKLSDGGESAFRKRVDEKSLSETSKSDKGTPWDNGNLTHEQYVSQENAAKAEIAWMRTADKETPEESRARSRAEGTTWDFRKRQDEKWPEFRRW